MSGDTRPAAVRRGHEPLAAGRQPAETRGLFSLTGRQAPGGSRATDSVITRVLGHFARNGVAGPALRSRGSRHFGAEAPKLPLNPHRSRRSAILPAAGLIRGADLPRRVTAAAPLSPNPVCHKAWRGGSFFFSNRSQRLLPAAGPKAAAIASPSHGDGRRNITEGHPRVLALFLRRGPNEPQPRGLNCRRAVAVSRQGSATRVSRRHVRLLRLPCSRQGTWAGGFSECDAELLRNEYRRAVDILARLETRLASVDQDFHGPSIDALRHMAGSVPRAGSARRDDGAAE